MEIHLSFININWLSVFVAAICAFVLGSLWYTPVLFGKIWMKELKITEEDTKGSNMALIFGTSFLLEFIAAIFIDILLGPESTLLNGLKLGGIIGIAWVATSLGVNYLFSGKTIRLFLIDAGYYIVFFMIMGAILGVW